MEIGQSLGEKVARQIGEVREGGRGVGGNVGIGVGEDEAWEGEKELEGE